MKECLMLKDLRQNVGAPEQSYGARREGWCQKAAELQAASRALSSGPHMMPPSQKQQNMHWKMRKVLKSGFKKELKR
jgi:hypothetical protein